MTDDMTFGAWLKRRRRQLDLTQKELAGQVGCSVGTIRKLEQDARRPSKQLAELLATELDIPAAQQAAFITFARTEAYTADMSETLAVLDDVESGAVALPGETAVATEPRPPAESIQHNLPLQATPFLGRQAEIAALGGYLADPQKRLITIVGPGGMGKTRLAVAVAENMLLAGRGGARSAPTHGVYFVGLAPLAEPEHIIMALAEALDFPLESGGQQRRSARQQILDYLRQKEMLLVLDNFEHLLTPAPPKSPPKGGSSPASPPMGGIRGGEELVADILQTAPQIQILVTSRERLHLHQEQVFALGGLDTPQAEQTEGVEGFTAVQLFLQSARRVKHDFQLSEGDQRWLTRICHLVAGMPLAVELAASWVVMLSLRDIAQEVQQSLDFLEADWHNVPVRHRSIYAVFESSWRHLSRAEKEVFPKLSIFRGGFTRQAAQTITGASLRTLGNLVNKSLLQYSQSRERYFIHELLRQYGAEKLAESGEETSTHDQYSRCYCQFLSQKEPELKSPQRRMALAEIQADLANIEAAWRWAVQRKYWSALHQADQTLFWFYEWHFRYQDILALCHFAVEHFAPADMKKIKDKNTTQFLIGVLLWQAHSYDCLNRWQRAKDVLVLSQSLLQSQALTQTDIRREKAFFYHVKAEVSLYHRPETLRFFQKSLSLARDSGDLWREVETLNHLGIIFSRQYDYEMAQKSLNEGLDLVRPLNDSLLTGWFLIMMGRLARHIQDYQQSQSLFKEALALSQSQNNYLMMSEAVHHLGTLQLFLGDFEYAADLIKQSIALQKETHYDLAIANDLATLAHVYTFSGHLSQAWQCIDESLNITEAIFDYKEHRLAYKEYRLATRAKMNAWIGEYEAAQVDANGYDPFFEETGESREQWSITPHGPLGWAALAQADFTIAKEHLQRVVAYNHDINTSEAQEWSAIYRATLSRAEWGLGQQTAARQHLLDALAVAVKIRAFITLLHVLPIVPVLLAAEEDVGHKTRAIEIYALAHSHPFIANCQFFYDIAGKDVEAVEAELPADVVAAAKAKGQCLDFWPTAESLLTELTELGWGEAGEQRSRLVLSEAEGGMEEKRRFVKEALVATGGFGEVYRGQDTETGQVVVIKRLKPELLAQQPDVAERFVREGELLRRLNHPNIVQMIASQEINGEQCLIMEYVAGGSLRDLLAEQAQLPLPRVLDIALELADALSRAHHLDIIHRDLKPGNVLLAEDGTPRLTDFGIARMAQREGTQLTEVGVILGTIEYMSPEACRGEALDARADIWSFGVLLYEMVTGQLPFQGEQITATILAILNKPMPDLLALHPEVPAALVRLIERMLMKEREERIGRMRQVAAELEKIRDGFIP